MCHLNKLGFVLNYILGKMPFAAKSDKRKSSVNHSKFTKIILKGLKEQINIKCSMSNLILRPPLSLRILNFNFGRKLVILV